MAVVEDDNTKVSADTMLGKFSLQGKSRQVAEVIAVLSLFCLGILGTWAWMHHDQTQKSDKAMVHAVREVTAAVREQTCVLKFEGSSDRQANADWCRRVAGSRPLNESIE